MINRRVVSIFAALALLAGLCTETVWAQTPASQAFTFQGELKAGDNLVNGLKDFRFRLFGAEVGGALVGPTNTRSGVAVVDGRFTVSLDFGASPFGGDARWLEISVAEPGDGAFVTLAPRQKLSATPYALYALNGPAGPQGPPGPPGPAGPTDIVASINMQFSQDDRSNWTHIEALGDDTCFTDIPLGFTFTGWGRSDTAVSISSNGVLFFGNGNVCSSSFANLGLPAGISNSPALFFFWDDLRDYGSGEYLEYATFGSAGGRVFNLYFRNRLFAADCGSNSQNIMISIHEGSNLISVSYSGFSTCAIIRGASATLGIQGPGGPNSQFVSVGYNSPVLDDNASRQSMTFQPPR